MSERDQRVRQTMILLPYFDYEISIISTDNHYLSLRLPFVKCWDCACSMECGLFATQKGRPRPSCIYYQDSFCSILIT
jgi:hypothetical protein